MSTSSSSFRHALNNSVLMFRRWSSPSSSSTITAATPTTITPHESGGPSILMSSSIRVRRRFTSIITPPNYINDDDDSIISRTLLLSSGGGQQTNHYNIIGSLQRHRYTRLPQVSLLSSQSFSYRNFSTGSGDGNNNGKDKNSDGGTVDTDMINTGDESSISTPTGPSSSSTTISPTTVEYDPQSIMKDFHDTSYYYHPPDISSMKNLIDKYSSMTNDELIDTSSIPGWEYLIHSPPLMGPNKLPKGSLVGTVVSTKMDKTVNVAVDRYKVHPKYRKRIKYTRKFMAHDEQEVAKDGDTVLIVPCQRISKFKHFMLREIIRPKGQL